MGVPKQPFNDPLSQFTTMIFLGIYLSIGNIFHEMASTCFQFVKYAVYASVIALDRGELHDKVVKGSEIAEVMHDAPEVQEYLDAFYNCQYSDFFTHLARVEQMAKKDR